MEYESSLIQKLFNKNFSLKSVVNDFALAIFPNKLKLTTYRSLSSETWGKETNALDKIQYKSTTERHKNENKEYRVLSVTKGRGLPNFQWFAVLEHVSFFYWF